MSRQRLFFLGALVLGAFALVSMLVSGTATAGSDAQLNRYPYDPACPWGRISNGKGMVIRCLTKAEAAAVIAPSKSAGQKDPKKDSKADSKKDAADGGEKPEDTKPDPKQADVSVKLLRVDVDEGSLTKAAGKLRLPMKRYEKCIHDGGGMTRAAGELHVRFLVRDRGRAEGVEVSKRRGISAKAGRCIAAIIDRRYVGHPAVPITGATAVFEFTRKAR